MSADDASPSDSSRPPIALPDGTRLREEYRIGPVLGTGSFGITYRARDEHLDTEVAIKEYYPRQIAGRADNTLVVRPHTEQDTAAFAFGREQFRQEGRTVARFDHPNVVDVRSYFEEHGTGYLVMDYYEGRTLADYLAEQGGTLPEEDALSLLADVLRGLDAVHAGGVLHRDIDPQNIYRTREGRAILIDFGAAREAMAAESQDLSVILKPGFAPFEQYAPDGDQGPHTDVYACAATLYKCLTGLTPPAAPTRAQEDKLVPPRDVRSDISLGTSVAVMKGLALTPNARPDSVEAFSRLLGSPRTGTGPDQVPTQTASSPTETAAPSATDSEAPAPSGNAPIASPENGSGSTVLVLGLAVAGLVGGTLAITDTRGVEVLSFFGTWVAVCFGLVALFREGEKLMSGEGRAAVSDWLLRENFARRPSNWPDTFTTFFDTVYGTNHVSWTCFWRSALTSTFVVTLLLTGFMGFGLLNQFAPESPTDVSAFSFLSLPILVNVVVDYCSLFETRWILGRMAQTTRRSLHLVYLVLDLMLTILCIFVPVVVLQIFLARPLHEIVVWSPTFWAEVGQETSVLAQWLVQFDEDAARLLSVMAISTLFTSVWVWCYVGAGLLLRVLQPVLSTLDWLKQHLDVRTRPLHAMGLLLAVFVSVGFAVSAPLVL